MSQFQQRPSKSILLIEVARLIREFGQIWQISKLSASTLFRATVFGQQIRVLMVLPGYPPPELSPDKGSTLYQVQSLEGLRDFLSQLGEDPDELPFSPVRHEV